MATLAQLVDNTYDLLHGVAKVERPEADTLNGAITNVQLTLTMTREDMWFAGDYAESEDDGEIIEFTEDHQAGSTAVLRGRPRGQTTAVAHSDGDVFYRNNPYPRYMMERWVNETVDNEFSSGIWLRNTRTLAGGYVVGKSTYELAAEDFDVEQMFQYDVGGDFRESPMPGGWWDMNQSVPTAVSSTGKLLRIFRVHDPDEPVYYTTRSRPVSTDLASLSTELANMVPWGAVAKALQARVGALRSAPNRSPQAVTQSGDRPLRDATFFQAEFDRMKQNEVVRLRKELMKERAFKPRRRRVG